MLVVGCQVYFGKVPPSDHGARTHLRSGARKPSGTKFSGVGAFPSLVVTA